MTSDSPAENDSTTPSPTDPTPETPTPDEVADAQDHAASPAPVDGPPADQDQPNQDEAEADQGEADQGEDDEPAPVTFADLGLRQEILSVLDGLGYEEPTAIQAEAIPVVLEGRDVLGQAATGTGKTAAFALPLLENLQARKSRGKAPVALVLVPTRELCMQVSDALHTYGKALGARVLPVYGGQAIGRQLAAMNRGVDIVVATPGRAVDHLNRGSMDLSGLEALVLDEADEMLDMGFADELNEILGAAPPDRQTLLFSATLAPRIAKLATSHMNDPVRIAIKSKGPADGDSPRIREVSYVVPRHHKANALARILDVENPEATIVFARTRTDVDELTETMNGRGYRAEALHGGMSQEQRDRVMNRLRAGTTELLIATDVAARGLDVDLLTHVVNYALPQAPEVYVHRIGRVGRAGREGVAITLVEPREHRAIRAIEQHTGRELVAEKVPTVADLRAQRLGLMQATLREILVSDDGSKLDSVRPVVESLSDEFDLIEIALGALAMAHEAVHGEDEDEEEVPQASLKRNANLYDSGGKGGGGRSGPPPSKPVGQGAVRIWISLGREANVRPKDLVGAIANETSLTGRDIGAIQIAGRFSLVDIPEHAFDEVSQALSSTKIRGRRAHVKRDKHT